MNICTIYKSQLPAWLYWLMSTLHWPECLKGDRLRFSWIWMSNLCINSSSISYRLGQHLRSRAPTRLLLDLVSLRIMFWRSNTTGGTSSNTNPETWGSFKYLTGTFTLRCRPQTLALGSLSDKPDQAYRIWWLRNSAFPSEREHKKVKNIVIIHCLYTEIILTSGKLRLLLWKLIT